VGVVTAALQELQERRQYDVGNVCLGRLRSKIRHCVRELDSTISTLPYKFQLQVLTERRWYQIEDQEYRMRTEMDPDDQAQDVGYSYALLLRFTRPLSYHCHAQEGVRMQNRGQRQCATVCTIGEIVDSIMTRIPLILVKIWKCSFGSAYQGQRS
jgi:hypothetical protein